MWLQFLSDLSSVTRPFTDWSKEINVIDIGFATDAAAGKNLGFGCVYNKHWSFTQWEEHFIENNDPSIEFLELYALCVGVFNWIENFQNQCILVHCDNEAVVHMINNTASSCPKCMTLIRKLTLKCLQANTRVFARHLSGSKNILPDRLSCLKINEFRNLTRGFGFDEYPTVPSPELWPLTTYWKDNCESFIN